MLNIIERELIVPKKIFKLLIIKVKYLLDYFNEN